MNKKLWALTLVVGSSLLFTGCMDITGRGPAPLAKTVGPATLQYPRAGHVYCMRGWLGIFSTGMDALADELSTKVGVPSVSVADEEWRRLDEWLAREHEKGQIREPLVLLGHSWGADDMIRVCEDLQREGVEVDLLVLIDPVTPPPVPTNVKRVYCIYKSHPVSDVVPLWRGVPARVVDAKATQITNIDLRSADVGFDTQEIDHINIEKSEGVHQMVMRQIQVVCPLRLVWNERHGTETPEQADAREGAIAERAEERLADERNNLKHVEVAIAVVFDPPHRRVLICKRKEDTVLGGYWEFPGGKCDAREAPEACVCREVMEELGIKVRVVAALAVIEHRYPHALVRLHPFVCEWAGGEVQLLAVAEARWIDPAEAGDYRFPEANVGLVRAVARGFEAACEGTN